MADSEPKLKIVRRRRKSVKSKIRARASDQMKQAAIEARKVAVLEYVAEQMTEMNALLRAEGFKVSRAHDPAPMRAVTASAPVVQHPCTWCGAEGVVQNETKNGWLCQAHGQLELGQAVADRKGQNLAGEMFAPKPIPSKATQPKPTGPKTIIQPTEADYRASKQPMFDPLKGVANGTVGVLGGDSDEAGDLSE
jgi:hypothetical protein